MVDVVSTAGEPSRREAAPASGPSDPSTLVPRVPGTPRQAIDDLLRGCRRRAATLVDGVSDSLFQVERAARSLSPASRRWRRFLRALPLDPDALAQPILEPGERDFIICGAPRTGTTLLSAMLVQPPSVITVMEPWDGMRLPPAALFASLRDSVASNGLSVTSKLDTSSLLRSGQVRWADADRTDLRLTLHPGYALGVKWPVFWRYLPYLPTTKFVVTLRNPFDVISSFRRQRGRLRLGLDYDTAFNRRMNAELRRTTRSPALRRIHFFDYIHERLLPFLPRPNVLVVRYERWFSEPQRLRDDLGRFLQVEVREGPARLKRPAHRDLSDREQALIRAHCTTGPRLGYDLRD